MDAQAERETLNTLGAGSIREQTASSMLVPSLAKELRELLVGNRPHHPLFDLPEMMVFWLELDVVSRRG